MNGVLIEEVTVGVPMVVGEFPCIEGVRVGVLVVVGNEEMNE